MRHYKSGSYYVICDVCGRKLRQNQTVLIKDKHNLLNNMLVCKKDADKTNPQSYVRAVKEHQIDSPKLIRSEGADQFVFASEVDEIYTADASDPTGRAPEVPRLLFIAGATASQVELRWFGPEDSGSSAIKGYKIERESPTGGGFSTVTSDTQSVATYYKDTTVSASTQYNYRVSAINDYTTGSVSNSAAITTNAS